MSYFQKRENVNLYTDMMLDIDNSFVINEVEKVLPPNSTLLELGMGTGLDLLSLSKKYRVLGSDYSQLFIDDFKLKSDLDVCVLDAVSIDIDRKFDCIYSNKVLQHLATEDLIVSLSNQFRHLNENGIIFLTLWNDNYREEFEFDGQLRFVYYDRATIEKLIPQELTIEKFILYSEFGSNDSMIVILRAKLA